MIQLPAAGQSMMSRRSTTTDPTAPPATTEMLSMTRSACDGRIADLLTSTRRTTPVTKAATSAINTHTAVHVFTHTSVCCIAIAPVARLILGGNYVNWEVSTRRLSLDAYRRFLGRCFETSCCSLALERRHQPPPGQQSGGNDRYAESSTVKSCVEG